MLLVQMLFVFAIYCLCLRCDFLAPPRRPSRAAAAARSPAARPRPRAPLVSGADRRGDRRECARRRAHHHPRLRPEARCAAQHHQPHLIGRRLAAAARLRSVEEGWLSSSPNRVPRMSRPHAQVTLCVACDRYGPRVVDLLPPPLARTQPPPATTLRATARGRPRPARRSAAAAAAGHRTPLNNDASNADEPCLCSAMATEPVGHYRPA